jgi:sialate O-acetylesterase
MQKIFKFSIMSLVIGFSSVGFAKVTLPDLFSDHMVVQQGRETPVWGWANPGEKITVGFGADVATTTTGSGGTWRVTLKSATPPGPGTMTVQGTNSITINDVLVGEVWVGSGQSNMGWQVIECQDAQQEIAAAKYPQIRMYLVDRRAEDTPQTKCTGRWAVCSPETTGSFPATAYYFGRMLHQELKVPVGIFDCSWGGSPCEAWTKKEVLESDAAFSKLFGLVEKDKVEYQAKLAAWQATVDRIAAAKAAAEKSGDKTAIDKAAEQKVPERPTEWISSPPFRPAHLYNGMILPLIPYGIRGVIWYQGESNVERAWDYRRLFPAMIQCWRQQWGQGDFPFLFVQLASFYNHDPEKTIIPEKGTPREDKWAELREAQLMALSVPNTGMASAIDIGSANNIHPKNKQEVGRRLALWALAKTYGRDIVYSGPLYKSMKVEGNKVRLSFDYTDGGLDVRQANTASADQLEGFAIAGADRKFVWADARIDGNTVVVWSDAVAEPVAVRYGWAMYPICNLFNKAGLPASPFRTDTWPISTQTMP